MTAGVSNKHSNARREFVDRNLHLNGAVPMVREKQHVHTALQKQPEGYEQLHVPAVDARSGYLHPKKRPHGHEKVLENESVAGYGPSE